MCIMDERAITEEYANTLMVRLWLCRNVISSMRERCSDMERKLFM